MKSLALLKSRGKWERSKPAEIALGRASLRCYLNQHVTFPLLESSTMQSIQMEGIYPMQILK